MPNPLKNLVMIVAVSLGAMIFGQFYFNGKPIAHRVASAVGQPVGYEIVQDTATDAAHYASVLGRKIPVWFAQARVTVAKWLYPSVTGTTQSPKD